MPGGRLTLQERRQVARGLVEGLAFAEIARRLDRPTSTITREVTRNGGPAAYRADVAQQATDRRGRRTRPAAPGRSPAASRARGGDAEALRDYEELFTSALVQSGLPRMMSRVLVGLYTTDTGGLTASELVERLQVSPASISKAIAFLERLDLVRRERHDRRDRYVVDDDLWYQSMLRSARDNARLADTARRGLSVLGPDTAAAARLANAARFLDFVGESITVAAEQAREILHTKADTAPGRAADPRSDR